MKVTILGQNGWYPSNGRETTSILINDDESCIIIDAGTGLLNLKNYVSLLEKYQKIHIILSHYHFDHTLGLTLIDNLNLAEKIIIYGPQISNRSASNILKRVYCSPYAPFTTTNTITKAKILSYQENDTITIGKNQITFFPNIHTDCSYSVSLNNKILISTDNILLEGKHDFSKYKLVLCEVWDIKEKTPYGHTSVEDLKVYLQDISLLDNLKIVAIHQNPEMKNDCFEEYHKRLDEISVIVGKDNQFYNV